MLARTMMLLILLASAPATAHQPLTQGEAQISVAPVTEQALPDVAADRLGNAWVVWKGQSNAVRDAIFLQRYDRDGQPNGPIRLLPETGSRPFGPRIGFDHAGNVTTVWHDREQFRLVGRRFDVDSLPLGPAFTIATFTQFPVGRATLAVAPDGHFVVVWADPTSGALLARRMGADGAPLSGVLTVNPTAGTLHSNEIAIRDNGDFVVSWIEAPLFDPVIEQTFLRFFDAQGVATSDEIAVGIVHPRSLSTPHRVLSAADDGVVVAHEVGQAISVQRFSWTGTRLGPEIAVSTPGDYQDHSPSIVRASSGELLVVWARERFPASRLHNRLWGRWLEADGTPRGAAFWMGPRPASTITAMAVTADGQGNVIVAHNDQPVQIAGLPAATAEEGHVFARRLHSDRRAGTLQLFAASSEQFEGDAQAAVTVVRSGGSEGDVSVGYGLTAVTAVPNDDYLDHHGVISFGDGETGTQDAAITLLDDTAPESDETVAIDLFGVMGGGELVPPEQATLTIIDNDFSTPGLQPASVFSPFPINPANPDTHRDPAAATHASGMHAVAWVQEDVFTGIHTVYARRFDRQGRPLGDPLPLGEAETGLPERPVRPALAFDAAGGFLVVWGVGSVQGRYVDATGAVAGEMIDDIATHCAPSSSLCPTLPYDPGVVAVSADTFAVVWTDQPLLDPRSSSVGYQLVERHGGLPSTTGLVSASAAGGRIAAYADGRFVVVWHDLEAMSLRAQRFSTDGNYLGSAIDLVSDLPSGQPRPAVAAGPTDRAFVAYQTPGTDAVIFGLLLDGDTAGTPFSISPAPAQSQERPAVVVDSEGEALVVWESPGREGNDTGLYARRFSATGQPRGNELRLMATRRGDQRKVALTAGAQGEILAVWEAATPAGGSDIFGRRLSASRCGSDARTLCLGDRFRVEVEWEDFEGRQGHGQAVDLTPDTGGFWFFDEDNIELAVKVLDGTPANGHYWVFYGALSNVAFDLTITDLETGLVAHYSNPLGTFASVGDIMALPALATPAPLGAAPSAAKRVNSTGGLASFPAIPGKGSCVADAATLCLGDGRFQITSRVTGPLPGAGNGIGQVRPLTDDTGTFWFFGEDNIELIIKVLDGTAANGHYWVFYGALSNVAYSVTVTDTVTGLSKTYDNPGGTFASVGDTMALPDTNP